VVVLKLKIFLPVGSSLTAVDLFKLKGAFSRLSCFVDAICYRVKKPGFFLKKPNQVGFWGYIGFFGQAGKSR